MRRFARVATVLAAAGAAAALVLVLAGCGGGGSASSTGPADWAQAHSPPPGLRLVLLSRSAPQPSEPGQILRARLVSGAMPAGRTEARVATDEDCGPDAAGISHCRNVLELDGGATIVVRHPHDMHVVPCLTPGERVLVQPA